MHINYIIRITLEPNKIPKEAPDIINYIIASNLASKADVCPTEIAKQHVTKLFKVRNTHTHPANHGLPFSIFSILTLIQCALGKDQVMGMMFGALHGTPFNPSRCKIIRSSIELKISPDSKLFAS